MQVHGLVTLLIFAFFKLGNIFKTEEEAEANKQAVWDRLTKEVEKC